MKEFLIIIQSKVIPNKKVKTTIKAETEKDAKKVFWKKYSKFKNNWRVVKVKELN